MFDDVRLCMACNAKTTEVHLNGENHIQIFHLGGISSDIYGQKFSFTVSCFAVKLDF